jgi:large subunit GTPase 1
MRSGQGNPDEARSARYILKDYVNGKLLFCHPPPGTSESSFNQQTHDISLMRVAGKKRAPVTRVTNKADTFVPPSTQGPKQDGSVKSRALDQAFFESNTPLSSRAFIQSSNRQGEAYSRTTLFPHQNILANDGTLLNKDSIAGMADKGIKHHKKMKRHKQRSGKGYD